MKCFCGDVDIYPEFIAEKIVKARKPHKCCECKDTIPVGTLYERVSGKWDGVCDTVKTCLTCMKIRNDYCDSFNYGELRESLWECLGLDYLTGQIDDYYYKSGREGE